MNRRGFLAAGCACSASLFPVFGYGQSDWLAPARLLRPDISSDEGGLWSIMDRQETILRRSPFVNRDLQLLDYVQDIACRLGGDHCPDIRVHLVRTPLFNANMAPNGMMQVWTGLMLRVDNEAQLAAVLGHEIGHYLSRHSVERLRDAKSRSAFAQFMGLLGVVGVVGQLATLAGAFAYSRDQEREADRIGSILMRKAGYDAAEAAKVWANLLLEVKARPGGDTTNNSPMFASHPPSAERQETLSLLAQAHPGGVANAITYQERTASYRREWLNDEIKRGQHEESLALLTRLALRAPTEADYLHSRAEVYRLRAKDNDLDAALIDYKAAVELGNEPPETHRGMGMIYRARHQSPDAQASFSRYMHLEPSAPDIPMIKSYVEEFGK